MLTYRRCLSGLLVRFQPLHPFFFFSVLFCCLLLQLPVFASDQQGAISSSEYSSSSDTSILDLTLPDLFDQGTLSRVNGEYSVFGSRFNVSASTHTASFWQLIDWNGSTVTYRPESEDTKRLVYQISNLAAKINSRIDAVEAQQLSVSDLNEWTNETIGAWLLLPQGVTNPLLHRTVPDLLALLSLNQAHQYEQNFNRVYEVMNPYGFLRKDLVAGDILAILSQNQVAQFNLLAQLGKNDAFDLYQLVPSNKLASFVNMSTGHSFGNMLGMLSQNQIYQFLGMLDHLSGSAYNYLTPDAMHASSDRLSITEIMASGFLGLGELIGGSNSGLTKPGIGVFWTDPNDPLAVAERPETYTNLFDFFAYWAENTDRSLVKLQYVLANDEDIEFEDSEKPNKDEVKDDFFGDGDGAVTPSDIKDASGLTSGVKDTFAGSGSASDAFQVANDSGSYSFFSQEVANDLDQVANPSPASVDDDSWLDQFEVGEDGFLVPRESSEFNAELYLEELLR